MASPIDLTDDDAATAADTAELRDVLSELKPYRSRNWRGWVQLATAIAAYGAGWVGAAAMWSRVWWLVPGFAIVVAVFLTRLFIIFHDCGHGSFDRSRRVNDVVGTAIGVLVFTPFRYWNYAHAVHHATSSNLDRRHTGDVWTMTVGEYESASPGRRRYYRLYHHPVVLLALGALIKFIIVERIVTRPDTTPVPIKRSVHLTNALLLIRSVVLIAVLGPVRYVVIEAMILVLGGSLAIWFFYVQHRFEASYWSSKPEWNFVRAGLEGSSYLKLNPVLQYASGNIGFHHLHHLDARIPNYNLPRCHRENPQLHPSTTITLHQSLAALHMKLWDERRGEWADFDRATT